MPTDVPTAEPTTYHGAFESIDEIITIFGPVMRAMATAAGPGCEVVLHDLSAAQPDLAHTIVAIENGHVTGRTVGGPSTNLGANVIHHQAADHNVFGYQGLTSDGRRLRCSSVYFRHHDGRIIAALCVNYDLTALRRARDLLDGLLSTADSIDDEGPEEFIGRDLVTVMESIIADAIGELGKPVGQLTRAERIAVLAKLDQQGATQMRRGVETIAGRLGISRVTAYSDLEQARKRPRD